MCVWSVLCTCVYNVCVECVCTCVYNVCVECVVWSVLCGVCCVRVCVCLECVFSYVNVCTCICMYVLCLCGEMDTHVYSVAMNTWQAL